MIEWIAATVASSIGLLLPLADTSWKGGENRQGKNTGEVANYGCFYLSLIARKNKDHWTEAARYTQLLNQNSSEPKVQVNEKYWI